eukprot:CAMPEP_0182841162 /NCGR_PEP_ID=MMETSP0006_2-20121128/24871_1 /TAXON_ID=97485 /ORGANISM="Prymnesium parvum, Strain Texoma1" /LENGTH=125 /DNA_ID=CAMNT_0024970597 /DNA_START=109 /DNA_END=485 /DNA_ORIENTATION=-
MHTTRLWSVSLSSTPSRDAASELEGFPRQVTGQAELHQVDAPRRQAHAIASTSCVVQGQTQGFRSPRPMCGDWMDASVDSTLVSSAMVSWISIKPRRPNALVGGGERSNLRAFATMLARSRGRGK